MVALFKTIALLLLAVAIAAMGLLIPAHIRSVDSTAIVLAGERGASIETRIQENLDAAYVGPALRLLHAAAPNSLFATPLEARAHTLLQEHPVYFLTGGPAPRFEAFVTLAGSRTAESPRPASAISLLLPRHERSILVKQLKSSGNANVAALLRARHVSGLVRLHPADHAAGAPFDASVLTLALLIEGGHFPATVSRQIGHVATAAADGRPGAVGSLESLATATITLGRALDFRSLAELASVARTPDDWIAQAARFRAQPARHDALFSAYRLAPHPGDIDRYLDTHPDTATTDIDFALRHGPDALAKLLESDKKLYRPPTSAAMLLEWIGPLRPEKFRAWSLDHPGLSLILKFGFFLCAGIAFSLALGTAWRASVRDARPLARSNPAIIARDFLIALVTVLVLWTLVEPDVLRSENADFPPTGGPRLEFNLTDTLQSLESPIKAMPELNQVTLLVLVLFFIIQLVIYVFGLIKMKEIAKQKLSADMKIRLLENEENLFDFGLYVGLGGTVFALILVAIGVVEASLMAAYASTLFGILFTALLKILHLRPFRRKLIIEAGSDSVPPGTLMKDIKL